MTPPNSASLRHRHQERALFRRYQASRDAATRDVIVRRHLGLARSVAARYRQSSVPFDDLMQIASLGLVKAIDRFDPDRGVTFSSFAVPTMVGELQRYFRDSTWAVRPPRELQERVLRLDRVAGAMAATLGRAPTAAELAAELGCPVEDVLERMEAGRARGSTSLDQPTGPDGEETLASSLGAEDENFLRAENAVLAEDLLSELTPRQRQILHLRFEQDLTQSEIGAVVGCSQMQVSRTIRAALDQLSASAAGERLELLAGV